jgi:hypothetical protein
VDSFTIGANIFGFLGIRNPEESNYVRIGIGVMLEVALVVLLVIVFPAIIPGLAGAATAGFGGDLVAASR